MKFGVFGINVGPCADPAQSVRVAQHAEQLGYESVWTGEHVVLPDPQAPPSPVPADTEFLDPAIALTFIAAHTSTLKLGTGIIILPQRNPAVLAKELASVDLASNGRLLFGIGVGYLRPEFDALGVSFQRKGARTDDYVRAMQALWTQDSPRHHGEFVSFDGIQALPRPMQKPHPPIVVGGHSLAAFRRAVEYGNGWYGFALNLEQTGECLQGLRDAEAGGAREASLDRLEISITPTEALDVDTVGRYEDLGVDRLIILTFAATGDETIEQITATAQAVGLS